MVCEPEPQNLCLRKKMGRDLSARQPHPSILPQVWCRELDHLYPLSPNPCGCSQASGTKFFQPPQIKLSIDHHLSSDPPVGRMLNNPSCVLVDTDRYITVIVLYSANDCARVCGDVDDSTCSCVPWSTPFYLPLREGRCEWPEWVQSTLAWFVSESTFIPNLQTRVSASK